MPQVPVTDSALPQVSETLEERFQRLAAVWQQAVALQSANDIRENHPAYRAIIALGPAVVPLLLRDLERTQRHWFAALEELTGTNPIPPEAAGRIGRMVEAWLNWGRENNYRW